MSKKLTAQDWHDEYFKALKRERELVKTLEIISNFTRCTCREAHGDNPNCAVLIAEQAIKNL